MFYKIVEISNLAEVNERSADGMVYVKVQFGNTAEEAASSPFLIEDFHMQIPARIIVNGEDQGEFPVHDRIIENIEAHIPRIQAMSRAGDRTHPRAVRDSRDPRGLIQRTAVQSLIGATRGR